MRPRAFTLIEMVIALTLLVLLLGLVVLHWGRVSPRQQSIAAARRLGLAIQEYRERAWREEQDYFLRLESRTGEYAFFRASQPQQALHHTALEAGLNFLGMRVSEQDLAGAVVLRFTRRGILPPVRITVGPALAQAVIVTLDEFINEVTYDEL